MWLLIPVSLISSLCRVCFLDPRGDSQTVSHGHCSVYLPHNKGSLWPVARGWGGVQPWMWNSSQVLCPLATTLLHLPLRWKLRPLLRFSHRHVGCLERQLWMNVCQPSPNTAHAFPLLAVRNRNILSRCRFLGISLVIILFKTVIQINVQLSLLLIYTLLLHDNTW